MLDIKLIYRYIKFAIWSLMMLCIGSSPDYSLTSFRMNLLLLLHVLSKSLADIVRHDGGIEAEFSVINKGRHFDEVIAGELDVSLERCQQFCVQHLKCKSINYNAVERKCELCDSDFDEWEALVEEMPNWLNYGTPPKRK